LKNFLPTSRNVLALGLHDLGNATVERANGVPTAWRIFPFAPVSITQDGETRKGEFLPEHADQICAYHETKGGKIPLDCEHYSKSIAALLGVEETEAAKLLKGERAAAGFGKLEKRPDGLWLTAIEWSPRARLLMGQDMYRYFSPVLRGLVNPPLRITSVALTNSPAIDQLDSLAAMAEPETIGTPAGKEPRNMDQIKKLLGLAPDADEAAIIAALTALLEKQPTPDEMACASELRATLGLGPSATSATLIGTLKALQAKAGQADADSAALTALTTRLQTLEANETARRRQALIDSGVAAGKLTPAFIESWAKTADEAALTAFLAAAPVICPTGSLISGIALAPTADAAALTAEDHAVATQLGIKPASMLATKKGS
jgi:phage I-like protein